MKISKNLFSKTLEIMNLASNSRYPNAKELNIFNYLALGYLKKEPWIGNCRLITASQKFMVGQNVAEVVSVNSSEDFLITFSVV